MRPIVAAGHEVLGSCVSSEIQPLHLRPVMQAIAVVRERGHGKPPQELAVSGTLTPIDPAALARLSDAERQRGSFAVQTLPVTSAISR
jgi:hypothetical protein